MTVRAPLSTVAWRTEAAAGFSMMDATTMDPHVALFTRTSEFWRPSKAAIWIATDDMNDVVEEESARIVEQEPENAKFTRTPFEVAALDDRVSTMAQGTTIASTTNTPMIQARVVDRFRKPLHTNEQISSNGASSGFVIGIPFVDRNRKQIS